MLNNLVASAAVVGNATATYIVLESGGGLITLVAITTAINLLAYIGLCVDGLPRAAAAAIARSVFQRVPLARGDELQPLPVRHQPGVAD